MNLVILVTLVLVLQDTVVIQEARVCLVILDIAVQVYQVTLAFQVDLDIVDLVDSVEDLDTQDIVEVE